MSCSVNISHADTILNSLSLFTLLTAITNHTHVHPLLFRHGNNEFSLDFHPSIAVFTPDELGNRMKYPSSFCHFQGSNRLGIRAWLSVCDPAQIEMILHAPNASFELRHENSTFWLASEQQDSCDLLWTHLNKRGTLDASDNFLYKQHLPAYYYEYTGLFARKRHVEYAMFADYSLFAKYGHHKSRTVNRMLDILHMANSFFDSLNIEIRLVHLEVFTSKDYVKINLANETEFLSPFAGFLKKEYKNDRFPHFDAAHLLIGTKQHNTTVNGRARYIGSICDPQHVASSIAWVQDYRDYLTNVAGVLAHELGHNLGIEHDFEGSYPYCDCPMKYCIMNPHTYREKSGRGLQYWSNCSLAQLDREYKNGDHYCLLNEPEKTIVEAKCGNGIVEQGEDCDCGPLGCITHTCCDMRTCKFRKYAECAAGACCNLANCTIHLPKTLCRNSTTSCDLPEFCDGVSVECPEDSHLPNGEKCPADQEAICYGGRCGSRKLQCKELWGESSVPSSGKCYEQNAFKHGCGLPNQKSDMKCALEDIMCGRLHCQVFDNRKFSKMSAWQHKIGKDDCRTALTYYQKGYEPDYHMGMTPNGASCGQGKFCLRSKCVSEEELLGKASKKSTQTI